MKIKPDTLYRFTDFIVHVVAVDELHVLWRGCDPTRRHRYTRGTHSTPRRYFEKHATDKFRTEMDADAVVEMAAAAGLASRRSPT